MLVVNGGGPSRLPSRRLVATAAENGKLVACFRIMTTKPSRILLAVIAGWLLSQLGCARSLSPSAGQSSQVTARRVLSSKEASELAARLANEQCQRQYRKRPFSGDQHSAVLLDGLYHWGGLDVGGVGGFSALVTFRQDGSEPHVEVYYSNDSVMK